MRSLQSPVQLLHPHLCTGGGGGGQVRKRGKNEEKE
jgi:hypothetical protein